MEAVKAEREEAHQLLRDAKAEIEGQAGIITELKSKLTDAMDTLKKNSETIEFLNQSLTEAQKFSFRALLSSKQPVPTASAAVMAPSAPMLSQQKPPMGQSALNLSGVALSERGTKHLSQSFASRARSPFGDEVRRESTAPLRLL